MKRIFLIAVLLAGFHAQAQAMEEIASIQIPGMRFYSVTALTGQEGRIDLLAAGEIKKGTLVQALIVAFSLTGSHYEEIAREAFSITPRGEIGKTRIRSLICVDGRSKEDCLIVVNGKGGQQDREVGFIRSYIFNKGFTLVSSVEFSDPETPYTHGYPLTQADMDGDGKNEIVHGGFTGHDDRDNARIRIFSIDGAGHLSPFKGWQQNRLDTLRLRLNALTSGDFNGDGKGEVVAAGRTVENDTEYAAFTVFSDRTHTWKQINNLGTCRYRYASVADMTGDGKPDLVLGGRLTRGETSYALLDVWQAGREGMDLVSRYIFSGAGSTRLRVVEPMPGVSGRLIIGGRIETLEGGRLKWKGFLQHIKLKSGTLMPCSSPTILDKDWETRVRSMEVLQEFIISGGFTESEEKAPTAFISVFKMKHSE